MGNIIVSFYIKYHSVASVWSLIILKLTFSVALYKGNAHSMIMILKMIYADSTVEVIYFNKWYKCSGLHGFSVKSLFIIKRM